MQALIELCFRTLESFGIYCGIVAIGLAFLLVVILTCFVVELADRHAAGHDRGMHPGW